MDQLNEPILYFEAFAKGDDGKTAPFTLRISQPKHDDTGGHHCIVECPYIREKEFRIYGVDEAQACELSVSFIRQTVTDQSTSLVDDHGRDISIPEVNWNPNGV
jgi:hypothetical protein